MKRSLLLRKNVKDNSSNYFEVFALPKTGKTTFLKKLSTKGVKVSLSNYQKNPHNPKSREVVKTESFFSKLFFFFYYFIKHPFRTSYVFYQLNSDHISLNDLIFNDRLQILFMRNSYMAAAFSRYEKLKNSNKGLIVDELILQSLFMILQCRSSQNEVRKLLQRLPIPDKIILLEVSPDTRISRLKKSINEGQTRILNNSYIWKRDKNQIYNYNLIKKELLRLYDSKEIKNYLSIKF